MNDIYRHYNMTFNPNINGSLQLNSQPAQPNPRDGYEALESSETVLGDPDVTIDLSKHGKLYYKL